MGVYVFGSNGITLELDSVQHQVECTQLSLQELKQKAERLKMKSRLVEQQQQNVKIQQGSLEIPIRLRYSSC